ncbi:hypothetical protein ACS0TY_017763 [Phlomoides rotata]
MREANFGNLGCMCNSAFDLKVRTSFGVAGKPSMAPSVICIKWQLPPCRFVIVNIDGGAAGAPGQLTGGGVFRDSFGVFRDCFAARYGVGFAFEAELMMFFLPWSWPSRNIGSTFGLRQILFMWDIFSSPAPWWFHGVSLPISIGFVVCWIRCISSCLIYLGKKML